MPTQNEYNVAKQISRKIYSKFEILNSAYQVIGNLEGVVIGSPSFTNDATSDLRRSFSMQLNPTDSSFDIKSGGKLWIDKLIKVYVGIYDDLNNNIVYTNMGIYIVNNPSYTYNAIENTLSISGLDLMAKLTGLRNGNLEGMDYQITMGSNIRNAIISTIQLGGFTRYICSECTNNYGEIVNVPKNINIDVGGTVYDILNQLVSILPLYQMYFDVDGVFHYDRIPSGENEQIIASDDLWKSVMVDYNINYDYESVKNKITVIGKTWDNLINYGTTVKSAEVDTYDVILSDPLVFPTNDNEMSYFAFVTPSSVWSGIVATINFKKGDGTLMSYCMFIHKEWGDAIDLQPNTYYVIRKDANEPKIPPQVEDMSLAIVSEYSPTYTVSETNPDSPFYINGSTGTIKITLSGGDYDNIYTVDLARQRSEFELYTRCRLLDSVTINCAPIYWLDVNKVVEITLPNKYGIEETNKYIVKQINTSYGVNDTQSITMMKYYPFYPSV